jgi:hypothetical protein
MQPRKKPHSSTQLSGSLKDYFNLETIPYLILIGASIVAVVDLFIIDFIDFDYMG